jgi:hypothetical protein
MIRSSEAMGLIVYNRQKGRLETIEVELTPENTTWFDDSGKDGDIAAITDFAGGLLIRANNYNYQVLVYDLSRADIGHNRNKARKIMQEHE